MFLATSSIFWWWTLRNLVISDHIILEKKASMIGIFVCSWCCFFPICKYLETFKRFVEERTLSLTCWWGYSLKFPHTTDTSLPDASLCMPFQTHYHILLLFLILFPFDFFVLFETCQHENLCNVSMQIISPSKWVEGKNLILKFLVFHLFFY